MPRITFSERHIGISKKELPVMLKKIGVQSLEQLIDETIPSSIRLKGQLNLPEALTEYQFLKELRMIALLRGVAQRSDEEGARWARMRIHRIASEVMLGLGYSSKLNAEWDFLTMLRDEGRRTVEAFLHHHCDDLGRVSSLDLDELLQGV